MVASETGDEKSHWVSVERWGGGHQASAAAATSSSPLLLLPFRVACPKRPLKEMANLEGMVSHLREEWEEGDSIGG